MTQPLAHADLAHASPAQARVAIRAGRYARHTAGLASGVLQCNLVILPAALALDFMRFCQRNPRPCPLVGVSDDGDPLLRTLGDDIDVRTDAPRYNVYRDGALAEQRTDIAELWRDDLVSFALGCSFTFERALIAAGVEMRHIERDLTVPMFRTTLQTVPAGPFGGGMVVSMRPIRADDLDRVRALSARFPLAHGAPVHAGDPAAIGIDALDRPDWGDPVPVLEGEVPVFWACGVTPQNAVLRARPRLAITHAPGHMLISDVPEDAESPILNP